MLCAPQPAEPLVDDWIARHRNPVSFALHLVGIPPTILGAMLVPVYLAMGSWSIFWLALSLFLGGYVLQFLGHAWEWTEPGEIAGIRQWLKPRLQKAADTVSAASSASASPLAKPEKVNAS